MVWSKDKNLYICKTLRITLSLKLKKTTCVYRNVLLLPICRHVNRTNFNTYIFLLYMVHDYFKYNIYIHLLKSVIEGVCRAALCAGCSQYWILTFIDIDFSESCCVSYVNTMAHPLPIKGTVSRELRWVLQHKGLLQAIIKF